MHGVPDRRWDEVCHFYVQNNSRVFYSSFCNCNVRKKTDDFELSLSLSLLRTHKRKEKKSLSLSLSRLWRAHQPHDAVKRTHHSFFLVSENNTGRLMMTFVCVCVQLVFDFEETKGTKDYCLGFSVENSKMFKNRLCRRFFHTSSSSSERCLVTHARTTHAYHPYSRR